MRAVFVIKINAIVLLVDLQYLLMCIMLQNQFFNKEECFFVFNMLSHLYDSSPCMRRELFFTVIALRIRLYELHNERLFY
jgi:hypothetical protein